MITVPQYQPMLSLLNVQLKKLKMSPELTFNKPEAVEDVSMEDINLTHKYASSLVLMQIKRITSPQNRTNWSIEDISFAIALRSVSTKAYNYLREVRKIPLPCATTLCRWILEFQVNPGILHEVVKVIQIKGETTFKNRRKVNCTDLR